MLNEIIPRENIKFKELEKEIFRYTNMLGCLILKDILEKQDEKIFNERDERKYESKGFAGTSIHTIMGNVVEKIMDIVKSNTYRDTARILEETTGVVLSFEAIRNKV